MFGRWASQAAHVTSKATKPFQRVAPHLTSTNLRATNNISNRTNRTALAVGLATTGVATGLWGLNVAWAEPADDAGAEGDAASAPLGDPGSATGSDAGGGAGSPRRRRRKRVRPLPQPGRFEEFSRVSQEVLQVQIYSGAMLDVNMVMMQTAEKQFSSGLHVQVDPNMQPEGRSAALTTTVVMGPDMLFARLDPEFRSQGRVHYNFTKAFQGRFNFALCEREYSQLVGELDYAGSIWTANLKAQKTVNMLMLGASYLQSITPNWALGTELGHQWDMFTVMSFVTRYQDMFDKGRQGDIYTMTISPYYKQPGQGVAVLNYARKLNSFVTLAAEFQFGPVPGGGPVSLSDHASVTTVGYKYQYQSFTCNGTVDSTGRVASLLETVLNPMMAFTLSGELQHGTKDSKLGVGLRVG